MVAACESYLFKRTSLAENNIGIKWKVRIVMQIALQPFYMYFILDDRIQKRVLFSGRKSLDPMRFEIVFYMSQRENL